MLIKHGNWINEKLRNMDSICTETKVSISGNYAMILHLSGDKQEEILCFILTVLIMTILKGTKYRLIESMMGLRPRQGNLRLVFRLFSLMGGLPSIRLK